MQVGDICSHFIFCIFQQVSCSKVENLSHILIWESLRCHSVNALVQSACVVEDQSFINVMDYLLHFVGLTLWIVNLAIRNHCLVESLLEHIETI